MTYHNHEHTASGLLCILRCENCAHLVWLSSGECCKGSDSVDSTQVLTEWLTRPVAYWLMQLSWNQASRAGVLEFLKNSCHAESGTIM